MRSGAGASLGVLVALVWAGAAGAAPDRKPVAPSKPAVHADAPALPGPTHSSERPLAETLQAKRYQFCHDGKYPLTEDEVGWCALLPPTADARSARCPAFAQACQAGATAKLVPPSKPVQFHLPDFGGLGRVVFYTLMAATVGALLFLLARSVIGRGKPALPAGEGGGTPDDSSAQRAEETAAIERDVNRLLARARAAAAAGDYLAAVADLHAALLRRLDGDGHIRIHHAATNGDYVRELQARAPALAASVRDVVGAVESIQFGVAPPANLFEALLERVTSLLAASARSVAVLALIVLAATGSSCDSMRPDWRDSPSGSAAVVDFLQATGIDARERLRPLAELGSDKEVAQAHDEAARGDDKNQSRDDSDEAKAHASLVPRPPQTIVILPDAAVGEADWTAVKTAAQKQDLTIVVAGPRKLPAWIPAELIAQGAAGPVHPTRELTKWHDAKLEAPGPGPAEKVARAARSADLRLVAAVPAGGWVNVGKPTSHQVLLRRSDRPYAVYLELGSDEGEAHGSVIVVADGHLFTNAALAVADNGALLQVLATATGGPIQIVTQETGTVATTPLESVSRGRLAPFMLQLCAFLILFFVLKGAAFGKLMDREVIRRRRFGEHVEALGLQYARARAGRHAATAYATWTVERLRERLPGDRGLGELAAATAARTGKPLGDVARLLFQSHPDEGADAEPRTRAAAEEYLQTIRALAALLAPAGGQADRSASKSSGVNAKPGETKS